MMKPFSGVVVPMVTPFTETGKIDLNAAEKIVHFLTEHGTEPFVLGTTGESASIPDRERPEFVRAAIRAAGKAKVFAGISSNCLETSVQLAETYFDLGVAAVVAHLPHYYPLLPDDMQRYFEQLVERISGPLILYNIPSTTHHSIPLDVVEQLSQHNRIVGLKDSERDLERLKEATARWQKREDFSLLIGWGAQSYTGLALGADGLVPSSGNVVPGLYQEMYQTVQAGDHNRAEKLQQISMDIAAIYQKGRTLSQSLAALKGMMSWLHLCGTEVLPPLKKISEEERNVLREKMVQVKILNEN